MNIEIGRTEANKDLPFIQWLERLPDVLSMLDRGKNILFLRSCCERLYGNYLEFQSETGWGSADILCRAIGYLIPQSPLEENFIYELQGAVAKITPNSEDFDCSYTSAALDAANAVEEALAYCIDGNVSHCLQVACLCRDSIYMFVQQRDDLDYTDEEERRIYSDSLMSRELAHQDADVRSLQTSSQEIPDRFLRLFADCCNPANASLRT